MDASPFGLFMLAFTAWVVLLFAVIGGVFPIKYRRTYLLAMWTIGIALLNQGGPPWSYVGQTQTQELYSCFGIAVAGGAFIGATFWFVELRHESRSRRRLPLMCLA